MTMPPLKGSALTQEYNSLQKEAAEVAKKVKKYLFAGAGVIS
jgi:hypothetical protein